MSTNHHDVNKTDAERVYCVLCRTSLRSEKDGSGSDNRLKSRCPSSETMGSYMPRGFPSHTPQNPALEPTVQPSMR